MKDNIILFQVLDDNFIKRYTTIIPLLFLYMIKMIINYLYLGIKLESISKCNCISIFKC